MANPNQPSACLLFACASLLAEIACAGHMPMGGHFQRPPQLVGEWIDLRHTTPGDTALWVLRDNGYDGAAHIIATTSENGSSHVERTERRYGSWYFTGALDDSSHRALCFARRLGRDGPTCMAFVLDTASSPRRLVIRGYQGEHHTGDRSLLERRP